MRSESSTSTGPAAGLRLRVVLDTNIYVAAVGNPNGPNNRILTAASFGWYQLLSSAAVLREFAGVLRRTFELEEKRVQNILRTLARVAELVPARTSLDVLTADPDDNRILECALDGKADLIVSNDRHLLKLGTFEGIPIVTGPAFRRILGIA